MADRTFIIGTAGHIDHGKTVLVKALTGVDTDRLPEEKARGISIELGFAPFKLSDGSTAGIVDVPGHENFVRTMVAGATGVDLALLVIAANDGVMPQTREHLSILDVLEVSEVIVAVTKIDLADEGMLGLVIDEVKELLRGTRFESSFIVPVSAYTGSGINRLREEIERAAYRVRLKDRTLPPRLPIDRVFTLKGIGTVVTGTLWSGILRIGDKVEIVPKDLLVRVRSIEVHNEKREEACAGERVALNIPGVSRTSISRGDTVTAPGLIKPTYMVDARVRLFEECDRPLKRGTRLRFHHGTKEILARIYPLGTEEIKPGESAPAQIRLEERCACLYGDRFVIRSYSPIFTIGGGNIVDTHPPKHKHRDDEALKFFLTLERGSPAEKVLAHMNRIAKPVSHAELCFESGIPVPDIEEGLRKLLGDGKIVDITLNRACHQGVAPPKRDGVSAIEASASGKRSAFASRETVEKMRGAVLDALSSYKRENPLSPGMPVETLRKRIFPEGNPRAVDWLIEMLQMNGTVELLDNLVSQKGARATLAKEDEDKLLALVEAVYKAGFSPPDARELSERMGLPREMVLNLLELASKDGRVIRVSHELYFSPVAVERAIARLKELASGKGVTVSEFKSALGTSRKYALPLLDYTDRMRITIRQGDVRKLRKG